MIIQLVPQEPFYREGMCVHACMRARVCVYVGWGRRVYTMCQKRSLCMYSPCQEWTSNQEKTHSIPAVGFGIRFGLVILENPGIDHKIMEVA